MNILIAYPKLNQYSGQFYSPQLGLAYISSMLKAKGHQVTCVNLNHYSDDSILNKTVEQKNIEVVCTGGQSPFYNEVKNIFDKVRKCSPEIITVLGGGIITAEPELIYKMITPTYGVIGEGEETVVELMEGIENKNDISKVKGVIYRDKTGQIIKNIPREPIANIDQIPFPDFEGFEAEKYFEHQKSGDYYGCHTLEQRPRILPIISSRGCPFLCTFCFHPLGRKYRQRPLDNFFEELELLISKYRINYAMVFDELFTIDKQRIYEFCDRMKLYKINWGTQMRVNSVDEETLKLLKESGCKIISYGIESASNIVLKSMKKAIKVEEINHALELTKKVGITIQGNLIIGDPAETNETVKESIDWSNEHPEYDIALGMVCTYPGSELYFRAIEKGLIKNKEEFLKVGRGVFNLTTMSDDQFSKLPLIFEVVVRKARIKNSGKNVSMTKILKNKSTGNVCDLTINCPQCNYLNEYKAFNVMDKGIEKLTILVCKSCFHRYYMISNLFWAKVWINYYKLCLILPGNWGVYINNGINRLTSLKRFTAEQNLYRVIRLVKRTWNKYLK